MGICSGFNCFLLESWSLLFFSGIFLIGLSISLFSLVRIYKNIKTKRPSKFYFISLLVGIGLMILQRDAFRYPGIFPIIIAIVLLILTWSYKK